jgi:hypothetical protein
MDSSAKSEKIKGIYLVIAALVTVSVPAFVTLYSSNRTNKLIVSSWPNISGTWKYTNGDRVEKTEIRQVGNSVNGTLIFPASSNAQHFFHGYIRDDKRTIDLWMYRCDEGGKFFRLHGVSKIEGDNVIIRNFTESMESDLKVKAWDENYTLVRD